MKHRATVIFSAAVLMAAATVADADEKAVESTNNVAESGLRVYVDPQSGELVSQPITAEQRHQANSADAAFNQDTTDLVPVQMPDGSIMLDLQGRFQQATVATVQPDGSIRTYCNDADHVAKGLHTHDAKAGAAGALPTASAHRDER